MHTNQRSISANKVTVVNALAQAQGADEQIVAIGGSSGLAYGIIAALAAAVALLGVVVLFFRRRAEKKKAIEAMSENLKSLSLPTSSGGEVLLV